MAKGTCGEDGCEEAVWAKDLCKKHYMDARKERLAQEKCKNPQCGNPRGEKGGYCAACYQRWLTYGDPNAGPPRRRKRGPEGPRTGTRSTYHVNHAMVRKERGPAWNHVCEHCGGQAQTWAQTHEASGEWPHHYLPLCWPCHARYDGFVKRLPDNTGSKRTPEARERMRAAALRREARKREAREAAAEGRLF